MEGKRGEGIERFLGYEEKARSACLSLIAKNRAFCVVTHLNRGVSEQSVFFEDALTDVNLQ